MFFSVIIILTILIALLQNMNSKRALDYYDKSLDSLMIKNEISQSTQDTYNSVYFYILEPEESNLNIYQDNKANLIELYNELMHTESFIEDPILLKNYQNLMITFLEQTDQTIELVNQNDVQGYSFYLAEAEKINEYIHEKTLSLIDLELANNQHVFSLINKNLVAFNKMSLSISYTILIFGIFLALSLSRSITDPIRKLTIAARDISEGNFDQQDVGMSTNNELSFLSETFNKMKHSVRENLEAIKEKSRLTQLLKESELRSLQNQINPHFLFNTLNTISRKAYIEGAEETSDLIASISTLLRYNIGQLDHTALLQHEVEVVQEYFFIQKTRFADKVNFETSIDDSCLSVQIPRLSLQPIVENAFMHGIEEMRRGALIKLSIYQDEKFIYIKVTDNGVGMDQQTVNSILNLSESEAKEQITKRRGHSTGLGIKNVISRLKLHNEYNDLLIESELGKGTTVTIKLIKQDKPDVIEQLS